MMDRGDPSARLLAMLDGYRVMQALYVAAELGVPDLLKDGPRSSAEIAGSTSAHAPSVRRLLRALASLEVLEEMQDGRFGLTAIGQQMRSDVPGSLHPAIVFYGGRRHWTAWGSLLESVKSGRTVLGARTPRAFFEMAARDPAGAEIFNKAMAALTGPVNASVVASYDFSRIGTLVDVGGGYGALLTAILLANPQLRGVLFDIPPVIEGARSRIEAAGLAQRCDAIGGDVFAEVPRDGDAYILKWVIHDWDDELSTTILRNCRAVMPANGKLLLVERVVPERAEASPQTAKKFLADLNMLLLTGGRERTESEYRELLAAAGFELKRVVPTSSPMAIIEAAPL